MSKKRFKKTTLATLFPVPVFEKNVFSKFRSKTARTLFYVGHVMPLNNGTVALIQFSF